MAPKPLQDRDFLDFLKSGTTILENVDPNLRVGQKLEFVGLGGERSAVSDILVAQYSWFVRGKSQNLFTVCISLTCVVFR
jgi:hypothetical protein